MEEPAEFGLLAVLGGIAIAIMFGVGFGLNYLLSRPSYVKRFPIAQPIRGAILSLMGVVVFALLLGTVISVLDFFIR
ncbi:MAG: hypothetical protein ABIO36_09280 [Pyrinomonadaceae bacterium]